MKLLPMFQYFLTIDFYSRCGILCISSKYVAFLCSLQTGEAFKLKKEGIDVKPEIMIPIVMTEEEIKFIKNGKKIEGTTVKGIRDILDEVVEEYGIEDLEYKVGSMI